MSAIRYPLNELLGSQAALRIMRILVMHSGALSAPQINTWTSVNRTSIYAVLDQLESYGLVEIYGSDRSRVFKFVSEHPLAEGLRALFKTEEGLLMQVQAALTNALMAYGSSVLSAWIYGSVARGTDTPGSDVDVAIVADRNLYTDIDSSINDAIRADAERLFFKPSIVTIDADDALRLAEQHDRWWEDAVSNYILLVGFPPSELITRLRNKPNQITQHRGDW